MSQNSTADDSARSTTDSALASQPQQAPSPASAPPSGQGSRPTPPTPAGGQSAPVVSANRRKPALLVITLGALLGGAAWGWWWYSEAQYIESTDNVYVQAPVVPVTARAAGAVKALMVDDTQVVQPGQVLLRLDDRDARLALDKAEAALAQTVREVQALRAGQATLAAQITVREAELQRANSQLATAQDDARRRADLARSGFVSEQANRSSELAVDTARHGVEAASAALRAAKDQLSAQAVLTSGTTLAGHPNVLRAAAAVREADLALHRGDVRAPLGGQIARRTVQVGQRIEPGTTLMTIVPLDQAWVEANFKEPQLRDMRVGQPVKLFADLYGKDVVFHGRIEGLAAGTGAAFALLPAQNATGNWIKVVQRVPVRIRLDAGELAAHPLRVGLSMRAEVDLREAAGSDRQPLAATVSTAQPWTSASAQQEDAEMAQAEARVQAIIAAQVRVAGARTVKPAVRP